MLHYSTIIPPFYQHSAVANLCISYFQLFRIFNRILAFFGKKNHNLDSLMNADLNKTGRAGINEYVAAKEAANDNKRA